jgi:hypothetical protein
MAALLLGFITFSLARRRPGAVSVLIGVAVAAGIGAVAYVALVASPERPATWLLVVGVVLLVFGCPAALLVAAAREQIGTNCTWPGAVDLAKFVLLHIPDPFWERELTPAAREVVDLAKVLFAYLAMCWLVALILSFVAHLANPPGSFR